MSAQNDENGRAVYYFGDYTLDAVRRVLLLNGEELRITNKPFDTLLELVARHGEIVGRDELLAAVWAGTAVEPNTVEHAVGRLRRLLQDDPKNPLFLQTVYGRGYRFIAEVRLESAESPEPPAAVPPPDAALSGRRYYGIAGAALAALLGVVLYLFWDRTPWPLQVTHTSLLATSEVSLLSPVLADRERLYFELQDGTHFSIGSAPLDGGPWSTLPVPIPNPDLCGLTHDGSTLLVRSASSLREREAPMFLVPLAGGEPKPVSKHLALDFNMSPDDRHILYTHERDLWIAERNGQGSKRLAALPGRAFWPRWSADGKALRVTVINPKSYSSFLWEVNADGTGGHRLFPEKADFGSHCCGNWTSDGRLFFFQASIDGAMQVWVRRESGLRQGAIQQLTFGSMAHAGPYPAKSGGRVYLRSDLARGELVTVDEARNVEPLLPGVPASSVDYSRDGSEIAFVSAPDRTLWRARADGQGRVKLTGDGMQVAMPRWSPRRRLLAFTGRTPGQPWKVYMIRADGGTPEALIPGDAAQADPDWSPDGESLVFGVVPALEQNPRQQPLRRIDLNTRHTSVLPGTEGLFSPRLSPDGRFLAAVSWDGNGISIIEMASGKRRVISGRAGGYPCWSHDGRLLYLYQMPRSSQEAAAVAAVRPGTGTIEKTIPLDAVRQPGFLFGTWIGLTPHDALIAVRDNSVHEVIALDYATH